MIGIGGLTLEEIYLILQILVLLFTLIDRTCDVYLKVKSACRHKRSQ
ncbi:MAG: hypothetical protein GX189_09890 [Clostridiales bacterium]|nr:hypothetical protein [Clostridiales bacterium]